MDRAHTALVPALCPTLHTPEAPTTAVQIEMRGGGSCISVLTFWLLISELGLEPMSGSFQAARWEIGWGVGLMSPFPRARSCQVLQQV